MRLAKGVHTGRATLNILITTAAVLLASAALVFLWAAPMKDAPPVKTALAEKPRHRAGQCRAGCGCGATENRVRAYGAGWLGSAPGFRTGHRPFLGRAER